MLYTCDALLPQAERYASLKFRRVSRRVTVARMDYGDALELAAFIGVVGFECARHLFQWNKRTTEEMRRLIDWEDAADYVQANLASVEEADGVALMVALSESGWKRRTQYLPSLVRDSLLAGWKRGESAAFQGRKYHMSRDQVQRLRRPRRRAADVRRAAEFAAIGLVFV